MENNGKTILFSLNKCRKMTGSPEARIQSPPFNYGVWRKKMNSSSTKILNSQKSLYSTDSLRTLLGDMSKLKNNILHSTRNDWSKTRRSHRPHQ